MLSPFPGRRLGVFLILLGVGSLHAAPYVERLGFSTSYPTAYADWADAFVAGNGKQGIMVFGNPLDETVIFNDRGFNISTNTERSFAQVSDSDLKRIRGLCAQGRFQEANSLAISSAQYQGGGEGNRHPGFRMRIAIPPDGAVTDYSRVCDFRTGEIIVRWTDGRGRWERRAFVSRRDNVTVQSLPRPDGGTISCTVELGAEPGMNFPGSWTFDNVSTADFLNLRVLYNTNAIAGYEGVTRVVVTGGTSHMEGTTLHVSGADSVLLLTRTVKSRADAPAQWDQRILQAELDALPADYGTLLEGQRETHGSIYDRVQTDFGAAPADRAKTNEQLLAGQKSASTPMPALWERLFDAGRYAYLSSSSEFTPPDLLGMWTGDCNAGWGGFYHLDANLNLQISQGNIGDMPEAMEGYFHINEVWQADFRINAQKLLGCRGMVAGGNTPGLSSGLISALSEFYPYQYATGEEAWLLYPFWEHYLVTGDTDFLRDRLYPLLKDMGHFYEDFLTYTDADGKYIFAGSVSPENQPGNLAVSLINNSTFDIAGARFALRALIETCGILGLDQEPGGGVETWTNLFNKLPPYLVNADGALQEWSWPGLADRYTHRHLSHLLTVWPYREITPESGRALYDAARVALSKKDAYHEGSGHGILHGALIAAGLNNGASVQARLLQLMKEDFYYVSLVSSHYGDHQTYCTDAVNAVPGIMMEMLASSAPGVLELLPALPAGLPRGSIRGMKGRNRVTIEELSWNIPEQTVRCTLRSEIDQTLTLVERAGIENLATSATVTDSPLGSIARCIQLEAGESTAFTLMLGDSSGPPAIVPPAPEALRASGGNHRVMLSWTPALGAISCEVKRSTTSGGPYAVVGTSSSGTFDDAGLTNGTRYFYVVSSLNAAGASADSSEVAATPTLPSLPGTPSDLVARAGNGLVDLEWQNQPGVTGFRIKRATTSGGPYVPIATLSDGTTAHEDRDLVNGVTYHYVVSALNDRGQSSNSAPASATPDAPVPGTNLARHRPVRASSSSDGFLAENAVDGLANSRWSSATSDAQWIHVDLGATYQISGVTLRWEAAYGRAYRIQTSTDGSNWTDIHSTTTGDGGIDALAISGAGRYVRMLGVTRGTSWGYSLWEFEVYGSLLSPNIALGQTVSVSTVADDRPGSAAVDGNLATRWSSAYTDDEWISIDLGRERSLSGVLLNWENAFGRSYRIQVSNDATNWIDVHSTTSGDGGTDSIGFSATGRHVRMLGLDRATNWGYSLWEFQVFASELPVVSVTATDDSTRKGTDDGASLAFTRTGSTSEPLEVRFNVASDATDAVRGADFELPGSSVIIPAGQSSASLALSAIVSDEVSGLRPATVGIVDHQGFYAIGMPATATVAVHDSPIHEWKIARFGSLAAARSAAAADEADPDGDGRRNLEEYALGRNPTVPESTSDADVETIAGEKFLTCIVERPRPAPEGVSFAVETGQGLAAAWEPAVLLPGFPEDLGDGSERLKYRSVHPVGTAPSGFIRLRIRRDSVE